MQATFVLALALSQANAFKTRWMTQNKLHLILPVANSRALTTSLRYGRGAEIWPECNEAPVQLKDSFPNGIIPDLALEALQIQQPPNPEPSGNLFLRIVAQSARGDSAVDVTPTVIAALLLIRGLVGPVDIMIVTAITGYWCILQRYSQSTRTDGLTPALPALPPQGHVPDIVANPLGNSFTNSRDYDQWLKISAVLSLLLPLTLIVKQLTIQQFQAARLFSRPLFLLCCQAMSESIARKSMAPLPVRILIPVLYNAIRLVPLWICAASPTIGRLGRLIAGANLGYWVLNLFAFLLPIATMRYLRAHFYAVEAEEVTVRHGFDASVGLLS